MTATYRLFPYALLWCSVLMFGTAQAGGDGSQADPSGDRRCDEFCRVWRGISAFNSDFKSSDYGLQADPAPAGAARRRQAPRPVALQPKRRDARPIDGRKALARAADQAVVSPARPLRPTASVAPPPPKPLRRLSPRSLPAPKAPQAAVAAAAPRAPAAAAPRAPAAAAPRETAPRPESALPGSAVIVPAQFVRTGFTALKVAMPPDRTPGASAAAQDQPMMFVGNQSH